MFDPMKKSLLYTFKENIYRFVYILNTLQIEFLIKCLSLLIASREDVYICEETSADIYLQLPAGFAGGLPIGMQIIGKPFSEETLLKIAHAYQQATDWHKRKPEI